MAGPFLPVRAISRSQRVRIGGVEVTETSNTYVDISGEQTNTPRAYPAVKELRSHLALGSVVVTGPITASNEALAIVNGLVRTFGKAPEPTYAWTAGEVTNRNTASTTQVEALATKKVKATAAEKERVDLFYIVLTGTEKGKILLEEGTATAKGAAAVKNPTAGAGHETWANLLVIKSYNATEEPTITFELGRA